MSPLPNQPPPPDRLAALFAAALPMAAGERNSYLAHACADDAPLRQLVAELLASHDAAPEFLQDASLVGSPPAGELQLRQVGPYRLLDRLGAGAMGVVYRAEQSQPRREVALKVLPPSHLPGEAQRRFRRETELLGRLQHPGIAQVFEAGVQETEVGSVAYFAMELVHGVPLDRAPSLVDHDPVAICDLVAKVADAVHHAHERGVVHRDLKPANILVSGNRQDGLWPKVLDFGIARSIRDDIAGNTAWTMTGQVIGTLAYMSPEQVRGEEVGPATDVFALGVILFELLTGRLPLPIAELPIREAMRTICDDEPPPLRQLRPALDADLSTLVAVAMAKDADRRYPSAAAFASDLRRFLRHEAIVARPISATYRLRKFVRRHRGLVVGTSTAFLFLLVGITVVSWLALQNAALAAEEHRARVQLGAREERLTQQTYCLQMDAAARSLRSPMGLSAFEATLASWLPTPGNVDRRDFEWYWLRSFGTDVVAELPTPGAVYTARWHPQRPWLLVGGRGFAVVYDVPGRTVIADLGEGGHNYGSRWGPDGNAVGIVRPQALHIAELGPPLQKRIVSLADADPTAPTNTTLQTLAWHHDGRRVATFSYQGAGRVCDLQNGTWSAPASDIGGGSEVECQPGGDLIATRSGLRSIQDLTLQHRYRHGVHADAARWNHRGNQLAVSIRGKVEILDTTGQLVKHLDQPESVAAMAWSPDDRELAIIDGKGFVGIYEVGNGRLVRAARSRVSGVGADGLTVDWSPDGRWLASGCRMAGVQLIDLQVPPPVRRLAPPRGQLQPFGRLGWHPDGQQLGAGFRQHSVVFDAASGAIRSEVPNAWQFCWSPDGQRCAWYREDSVYVREADGSTLQHAFPPQEGPRTAALLAWAADNGSLLVTSRQQLFHWRPGQPAQLVREAAHPIGAVAWAPQGPMACFASDRTLEVLEPATGRSVVTRTEPHPTWLLAWSNDGKRLATAADRRSVILRDATTLAVQHEVSGLETDPAGLSWQPDDRRIAVATRAGVYLLDPDDGTVVMRLPESEEAMAVAFAPDGRRLAVMLLLGEITLFDARNGYQVPMAPR